MRRLLSTGSKAAVVYAISAVLIVVASWLLVPPDPWASLWMSAVVYLGPAVYFTVVAAMNRSAFAGIGNSALRWIAVFAMCGVMTAVSTFLVFVLAVNVYLGLGGRI